MTSDALLSSLRAAVESSPGDTTLRLHLASLLAASGQRDEAVRHAASVLTGDPGNAEAMALLTNSPAPAQSLGDRPGERPGEQPAEQAGEQRAEPLDDLDRWAAELADPASARFVESDRGTLDVQPPSLRLADVAGMDDVKAHLEASLLAPMRSPELARLYQASLSGGLLLYGPPGCGKTFLARAVAGELGAAFLSVSLADVLDMWVGSSERNVHDLFETARAAAPCVVFLDEVDALGLKRSQQRNSAARGSVNQLLTEMDGVGGHRDGVFVLGATNAPWDVDVALRRPGRFDRMLLVAPPDAPAREAILRFHLRDRPVGSVDLPRLAQRTETYSGADLAHLCEVAAKTALMDSVRTGTTRPITMGDLGAAADQVRPSTGPWLETARNVAEFANEGGAYDDLLRHLRRRRRP